MCYLDREEFRLLRDSFRLQIESSSATVRKDCREGSKPASPCNGCSNAIPTFGSRKAPWWGAKGAPMVPPAPTPSALFTVEGDDVGEGEGERI